MKTLRILSALVLCTSAAFAQLISGPVGLKIKSGTVLSVDGLTLRPAADIVIANNSLEKSAVEVQGSINRVYGFQSLAFFEGLVGIQYLDSELNGNPEKALQLFCSANGINFTPIPMQSHDLIGNYVTGAFGPGKLLAVTAKSTSRGARTAAQPPEAAIAADENKELPDGSRLILAGNPVESRADLRYQSPGDGTATIRILDLIGKERLSTNVAVCTGVNRFVLPVEKLPAGLYIVEVIGKRERTALKLVKQ